MADQQRPRPVSNGLPVYALLAVCVAGLYSTGATALPSVRPLVPAAGAILIEDPTGPGVAAPATGSQERSPFAELNEALAAARARLQELSRAATVAAAAGGMRKELETTKQENEQLRAQLTALQARLQATEGAETRIAELSKAAEDAAADAKRIEAELVTMRWQNAQLNTSLARAQAAREQVETEARKARDALAAKVETLSKSAEQSAGEITRLHAALADAEQRLEIATSSRNDAEARLAELQAAAQSADTKSARLEEQMTTLRNQLAQAEGERDQAQKRIAALGSEADRLQAALASAEAEGARMASSKRDLEQEIAQLRAAAGSATDAARQNLLAVEERIKELNAALGAVVPAADVASTTSAAMTTPAGPASESTAPQALPPLPPPTKASPPEVEVAATTTTEAAAVDADLDLIKTARAGEPLLDENLMRLTASLPLEKRLQVQGLLVDLGAKAEPQGFALTVPGEGLFALNSDQIEPTAHDTLAKVAELINTYDDRKIRIVGYTDSLGDAAYNKVLSRRRASLVKEFFVDNFEIDGARLSIEGRGEEQPIAPNDTLTGRQANRRVEVLILN